MSSIAVEETPLTVRHAAGEIPFHWPASRRIHPPGFSWPFRGNPGVSAIREDV
jgi:hypothetical protein